MTGSRTAAIPTLRSACGSLGPALCPGVSVSPGVFFQSSHLGCDRQRASLLYRGAAGPGKFPACAGSCCRDPVEWGWATDWAVCRHALHSLSFLGSLKFLSAYL